MISKQLERAEWFGTKKKAAVLREVAVGAGVTGVGAVFPKMARVYVDTRLTEKWRFENGTRSEARAR